MNENESIQRIDEQIKNIRQLLLDLGSMHPGSISEQYHYCQKKGCKCQHPDHPQPHGPYAKLTFVFHGKSHCRFVRAESVAQMNSLVANYKTFRQLIDQWVELSIARAQLSYFNNQKKPPVKTSTAAKPAKTRKRSQQS